MRNKQHALVSRNNQVHFSLLGKVSFQSSGCTLISDRWRSGSLSLHKTITATASKSVVLLFEPGDIQATAERCVTTPFTQYLPSLLGTCIHTRCMYPHLSEHTGTGTGLWAAASDTQTRYVMLLVPAVSSMFQLLVFLNIFEVDQVRNFVQTGSMHMVNICLQSQFRSRQFKIFKSKILNTGLSTYFFMPCDTLKNSLSCLICLHFFNFSNNILQKKKN